MRLHRFSSRALRRAVVLLALCSVLLAGGSSGGAVGATARRTPILYSSTVLLIDDHRVEATSNLARNYLTGAKVQVDGLPSGQVDVTRVRSYTGQDDASDGDTDVDTSYLVGVDTVIKDVVDGQPLYRMWLRSGPNVGYRESTDGLHWHIHDPDSVVVATDVGDASVLKDYDTGLYYLIGWSRSRAHYVEEVSRDGLRFRPSTHFAGTLSELPGDVVEANSDPVTGDLAAIAKERTNAGISCGARLRTGGRTFGIFTSTTPAASDLSSGARTWTHPGPQVMSDCIDVRSVPRTPDTMRPMQHYGMSFQRYGDQFIGFPWLFHVTAAPPSPEESGKADGPIDTQIASTPDIVRVPWTRSDPVVRNGTRHARPVLIQRGPAGSWDGGMLFGQANLISDDTTSTLYYTGWNTFHRPRPGQSAGIGAAQWRLDRFVGRKVVDPRRFGYLRTKAFVLPSNAAPRDLVVNASLAPRRFMRVGVLDARTNRPIPGFGLGDSTVVRGDNLAAHVTWLGRHIGALRSRPIRLLFRYGAGSLYSFRVM